MKTIPSHDPEELTSWKEIAEYLHVSVRTAQKWEQEKGLPVQRMGGPCSPVAVDVAELRRWRQGILRSQHWWSRVTFSTYYAVIMSILLMMVVAHDLYFDHYTESQVPASFRSEENALIAEDQQGRLIWRTELPYRLGRDSSNGPGTRRDLRVSFDDIDGDGKDETLFHLSLGGFGRDILHNISASGKLQWMFEAPNEADSAPTAVQVGTVITNFAVSRFESLGEKALSVLSCSLPNDNCRLSVLSGDGKVLGSYLHSGHLEQLAVADIDEDGIEEIVVGGVNAETAMATLLLCHPPSGNGALSSPHLELEGEASERIVLEAIIRFPRTCVNRKLESHNQVVRLAASKSHLHVGVAESNIEGSHEVCYVFDGHLRLVGLSFCDSLLHLHRRMEASGLVDHAVSDEEIDELRAGIDVQRFIVQ